MSLIGLYEWSIAVPASGVEGVVEGGIAAGAGVEQRRSPAEVAVGCICIVDGSAAGAAGEALHRGNVGVLRHGHSSLRIDQSLREMTC